MRLALVALLALGAAPVLAQQAPAPAPASLDVSKVPAGTYTADSNHTQVLFTVTHFGFTRYTGQFTQPTGTLVIDPAHPEKAKVEISFPIAKIAASVEHLNLHVQAPEFFDSAHFPDGKFVSTKVTVHGTNATIAGNLTLKGVTRPIVLDAHLIGTGAPPMGPPKTYVGFAATTSIKRSDFGINALIPIVSDQVDLVINAGFSTP